MTDHVRPVLMEGAESIRSCGFSLLSRAGQVLRHHRPLGLQLLQHTEDLYSGLYVCCA